tara:strand:+ start:652 stop:1692 length:1041 start_codon:yes stop_codon:yes gene_type:complete
MKLFDLDAPQTKKSQKVLESYFGNSVDFNKMSLRDSSNMLTKVRGLIYEHRTTKTLAGSEKNPTYLKLLVMERGLHARLREADVQIKPAAPGAMEIQSGGKTIGTATDQNAANEFMKSVEDGKINIGDMEEGKEDYSAKKARAGKDIGKPGKNFAKIAKSAGKKYGSKKAGERVAGAILNKMRNEGMTLRTKSGRYLTENEVQQAQVVLAAQDMVDRMQSMLEDITSMQFKDLPALSSSIQTTIGTNEAQAFNDAAGQSLAVLVDAIQASKVEMEAAQGTLTGVEPVVPGQEEVAGTPAVAEPVADPLAADPIDAVADVNVDAEAGGEAVDVNVDVQDGALGRARR